MGAIAVIGAGAGGLSAAIQAAQRGHEVMVFEARSEPGGLAASVTYEGLRFDAGPYILLDRPGLDWAFQRLGLDLERDLDLRRIEDVYEVDLGGEHSIRFYGDLERTITELNEQWPDAGDAYRGLVESGIETHQRIRPLQWTPEPGPLTIIKEGAWRDIPFLLRSLGSILDRAGLPAPVERAVSIWTYVAGQSVENAPSPLALVPALIHHVGAYYPVGGIGTIPETLAERADALGVSFSYESEVQRITVENGTATGVLLENGDHVDADAVVSNYSGIGTYLELVEDLPSRAERSLRDLPLQSPGVCGYLRVKGEVEPPFLNFRLGAEGGPCRLFIQPGVVDPTRGEDGWLPARLLGPIDYDDAIEMSEGDQRAYLDSLLAEEWWHEFVDEWELVEVRTVDDWGRAFNLYRNSMNPVMTSEFMRQGRMDHRSPYVENLYLAGSSTHPGQWVSFCTVSGIHAADLLEADLS